MNKLTNLKLRLLSQLPFFHSFLSQCNVHFTTRKDCKTAYITVKRNGSIEIGINEEYYDFCSANEQLGMLQHEVLHLIFEHLGRSKEFKDLEVNFRLLNVAQDLAINQVIEKQYTSPKWCHIDGPEFGFEADKTSEYYYLQLMKDKEKYEKMFPQDDHELFEVECNGKLADAIIKEAIAKAYKKNYGNINQRLKQFLDELLAPPIIPWQTVLRKFIGMNISTNVETSRTRANRRLGLKAPGYKKEYKPKIARFRDESGSVDSESLQMFNNELAAILKATNAAIDDFAFDTEVEYLGSVDSVSKISKERHLSGGTSFVPVFEEAERRKSEVIIIFTDGYGEMPASFPKKPILWVLNHAQPLDLPGTVLHLTKGDK